MAEAMRQTVAGMLKGIERYRILHVSQLQYFIVDRKTIQQLRSCVVSQLTSKKDSKPTQKTSNISMHSSIYYLIPQRN